MHDATNPEPTNPEQRTAGTLSPVAPATAIGAPALDEHNEPPEGADALREDIERTRDRMSETLDRIENRIVRRRDEVWSKATLRGARAAIASEPWRSLLIAFAAGYVLAAMRD